MNAFARRYESILDRAVAARDRHDAAMRDALDAEARGDAAEVVRATLRALNALAEALDLDERAREVEAVVYRHLSPSGGEVADRDERRAARAVVADLDDDEVRP